MLKIHFIVSVIVAFVISLIGPAIILIFSLSVSGASTFALSRGGAVLHNLLPIITWVGYVAAGMFIGYYSAKKAFVGAALLCTIIIVLMAANTYSIIANHEQLAAAGINVDIVGASRIDLFYQIGIKYFLIIFLVFIGAWLGKQINARRTAVQEPLPPQQP